MSYNLYASLKDQLPEKKIIQLCDDEQLRPDVLDSAETAHAAIFSRINEAGDNADAEADSYCGAKYSVPFATPPAEVKRLSLEIWIYNLYKRRTVPEEIEKRYDKAIRQLQDIAKGIKTLGVDPPPSAPTEGGAESNKTESDRIFTRTKLEGF
jgi:phage gp36-like protein